MEKRRGIMLSERIADGINRSSWIRAMFEEGEKLRAIHGSENVFDFSLGNPDVEPPKAVNDAFKKYVMEEPPGLHRYMSNAGFLDVRSAVAAHLQKESGVPLKADHIIMTCGAAGGLNVVLRAILNPDDEVIILAPFFAEYLFYIDNHGGKSVIVNTSPESFQPDPVELAKHITPKTKAVILNSPNNPTGVVYSKESLQKMSELLTAKEKEFGKPIFFLLYEPYNKLVYDGTVVPQILQIFRNSFVINSYSKSLSLPGERIGFIAVNPEIENCNMLIGGLIFCNRTLGFVNAPALAQKVIAESLDANADVGLYKEKRDLLYNHLTKIGFSCIKPEGAFYLFPKALIPDDVKFVEAAQKYNILLTPGRGFGWPGYVRIAYCVSLNMIERSLPAFDALVAEIKGK
jgi:aspartate aminotransferase